MIVAIDGYAGTGKSSSAKEVARQLNFYFLDTGAMYRAATYFFLQNKIDLENSSEVAKSLPLLNVTWEQKDGNFVLNLNGQPLTHELRTGEINSKVSKVSSLHEVRKKMITLQRQMAHNKNIVLEGRDIGTVVFPDADIKFFLTATPSVRAKRRYLEMVEKGIQGDLKEIAQNIKERDEKDSQRLHSPLKKAHDALLIDTSHLTFDQQVEMMVKQIKKKYDDS